MACLHGDSGNSARRSEIPTNGAHSIDDAPESPVAASVVAPNSAPHPLSTACASLAALVRGPGTVIDCTCRIGRFGTTRRPPFVPWSSGVPDVFPVIDRAPGGSGGVMVLVP